AADIGMRGGPAMRSTPCRCCWMVVLLLVLMIQVAPALAAAPDLGECAGPDPVRTIAACTALLQQPGLVPPRVKVAIFNHRGEAYVKQHDYDRAIADYDAALQIAPNNPFTHNFRGIAYRLQGEFERAIAEHNVAIGIDPHQAPFFYFRGLA